MKTRQSGLSKREQAKSIVSRAKQRKINFLMIVTHYFK